VGYPGQPGGLQACAVAAVQGSASRASREIQNPTGGAI